MISTSRPTASSRSALAKLSGCAFGSVSGMPESRYPSRYSASYPMMRTASSSSRRRTAARSARTSSESASGFRMSPASPPVHVTSTVRTPSAPYRAMVAAPLDASSSGWACTESTRSAAGGVGSMAPHATAGRDPARALVAGTSGSRLTDQAVAAYTSWSVTPPIPTPTGATMATKTADPTAVFTDAVLAGVKQSQELAFSGISLWIDFAGKAFTLPELDSLPFVDQLPSAEGRRRVQLRLRRGAARHAEGLRDQGRRRRHARRSRRPDRPTARSRPGSPHRAGTQSFLRPVPAVPARG